MTRPQDDNSLNDIRETLLKIVGRCLEEDPKLVPISYHNLQNGKSSSPVVNSLENTEGEDDEGGVAANRTNTDDFVLYAPEQAERIAYAVKEVRSFFSRTEHSKCEY